jgi:hypothetical protein
LDGQFRRGSLVRKEVLFVKKSWRTALFEPGGVDPFEAAVLERDVQPLIDERLEALFRETSNYRRYKAATGIRKPAIGQVPWP